MTVQTTSPRTASGSDACSASTMRGRRIVR